MTSRLEGLTLFEALNELVNNDRSGRLHVQHWEGKRGVIGLNDGDIVHCHYGKLRGMNAFNILRNWISISLHFYENVENLSVDIEAESQEILSSLEALHWEIEKIRKLVPTHQTIFALASDSPHTRVSLDQRLWKVLSLTNGRNSVKDICLALGATEFSVTRVLAQLHRVKIIRMVATEQPMNTRLREAFFEDLENSLTQFIGPIAPVVIEDTLAEMNKSPDYINRNDLPLLVDRIGQYVDDDDERIQFQGHMLVVIQRIAKGEA